MISYDNISFCKEEIETVCKISTKMYDLDSGHELCIENQLRRYNFGSLWDLMISFSSKSTVKDYVFYRIMWLVPVHCQSLLANKLHW